MNRRLFLRSSLTAAAGLVVGDAALEAYERLAWKRRFWQGWRGPELGPGEFWLNDERGAAVEKGRVTYDSARGCYVVTCTPPAMAGNYSGTARLSEPHIVGWLEVPVAFTVIT